MGSRNTTPKPPIVEQAMKMGAPAVVKTHDENGLHFFTINMDANSDGSGVSPWSVVGIIVATLLVTYLLRHLLECCRISIPCCWPFSAGPTPRMDPPAAAEAALEYELVPAPVRMPQDRPLVQNRFGMYRSASEMDLSRLKANRGPLDAVAEEPNLGASQKPAARRIVMPNMN